MTEHQPEEIKQWCYGCGHPMTKTKERSYFDSDSGKEHFNLFWRCPMWRWWNPLSIHAHYWTDEKCLMRLYY